MFDQPTVLVVGAGAGFDIEMPLGDVLADRIAQAVDFYFDPPRLTRGDAIIAQALQSRFPREWQTLLSAGRMIAGGIRYSKSIDNYVHTHSDKEAVKTVAKVAIVKTILDAERHCHLYAENNVHPVSFRDEEKAHRSWFTDLFGVLQDGVVEARNLDEIFSNLTIINFNYDRCIEHYFFHVMKRLYPTKQEYLTELLNQKLRILHPYGKVGSLPWQSREDPIPFGGSASDLVTLAEQIRTYNEEVQNTKVRVIRETIDAARRIVFLGFHFHKQNVELLAPEPVDERKQAVLVYATQVGRSPADIEIIESRLVRVLNGRRLATASSFQPQRGCKELFRDFGGVLAG